MASDVERRITLRALYDGTQLKQGTTEAETHLEALERATADTSDDINRSLRSIDDGVSSTLGSGGTFDRAVDDVETSGRRMKDIGSEVGSEFAENIGEGIRSGDIGGSILETFTSLGPALGVAGIGIAAGAGIINGIISGFRDRRAELIENVSSMFSEIEVKATDTAATIQKAIRDTYTFKDVVAEVGGGDETAGMKNVEQAAAAIGVDFNAIVDVLRGAWNPAAQRTLALLQAQSTETETIVKGAGRGATSLTDQAQLAQTILDLSQARRDSQSDTTRLLLRERDYVRGTAGDIGKVADDAERVASANERAAAAAQRMADAYRTAAQQRLPDNLW